MSGLEETLASQLRVCGLPQPKREYRFDAERRWRFDFAWPKKMVAAEVEGGTWRGGRHTRGNGFEKDCEKYNAAVIAGWRVLRFTSGQVQSGYAINTIEEALK